MTPKGLAETCKIGKQWEFQARQSTHSNLQTWQVG